VRFARLGQWEPSIDDDPEVTQGDVVQDPGNDGVGSWAEEQLCSKEVAHQGLVVGPHGRDVQEGRDRPAGIAERYAPAPVSQTVQALLEGGPTDAVDDHVGAGPVGQSTDGFDEIA
jgi:hypothetical protein